MLRTILAFGLAAGVIVAVPMFALIVVGMPDHGDHSTNSMITGFALMFLALSLIFVAVKRYRDRTLGGIIRFLPALGLGLGISVVAAVVYVVGWEITQAATGSTFASDYAAAALETARAKGASATEIASLTAEMEKFRVQYANPLFRLPMTFVEIFPVGVLISFVAAGLLRNSRFLPARVVRAA